MKTEATVDGSARRAHVESLYDLYARLVYRTCRAILLDHHDAEDAAQEVFGKLLARDATVELRDERRWLLEVTRNHCFDRVRAAASRQRSCRAAAASAAPPCDDAEGRSVARAELRWLFSQLTPRQRELLVRQALLDEPLDEVASAVGLTYGAAAQVVYRARHALARARRAVRGGFPALAGARMVLHRRARTVSARLVGFGRRGLGWLPIDPALALPAVLIAGMLGGATPILAQAAHRPSPVIAGPSHRATLIAAIIVPQSAAVARVATAGPAPGHRSPAVTASAPPSAVEVPSLPPAPPTSYCLGVEGVHTCFGQGLPTGHSGLPLPLVQP